MTKVLSKEVMEKVALAPARRWPCRESKTVLAAALSRM